MDLEVVGRHALLFDDDAMAAFVNSQEALVDWNSLAIDRYDVRHLLSDLPPRKRSSQSLLNPDASIDSELDRERYLDLPSSSPSNDEADNEEDMGNAGGFHAVGFSYGNPAEQKDTDVDACFSPPFSVPDSLLQNLPPTEKVHQIMARTAMFVSKHGGQSEIVLRVKQGDNPTFGFLMPDHHLHLYFRFLVDHQELLISKSLEGENKADNGAGALSLLGSVYGEDEDGATEDAPKQQGDGSEEAVSTASLDASRSNEQIESSVKLAGKKEVFKHSLPPLKEKPQSIRRNGSIATTKTGTGSVTKKDKDHSGSLSTANKTQGSIPQSSLKVERPVVEPPSELKRVIEKIVEFIVKNGKQFEAVLIEQDNKHGRFPFLLSSNLYHPYYLEVLQKTEESDLSGKGVISDKREAARHRVDKKTSPSDTVGADIPYESDRKEKFKMVIIGKSKKDCQNPPSKPPESEIPIGMDAAATAAILQAARKGIKNPNLGFLSRTSSNDTSRSSDQNSKPSVSVTVANAIARTAAIAAASEADSSEASMTKEQKMKAERLKRAKLFTANMKGGAVPGKSESSCGASVEPGISESGAEVSKLASKEIDDSSFPINDVYEITEKSEKKVGDDERRSKRSYRSRPITNKDEDDDDDAKEEERDGSRKRRKSHRSSSHHTKEKHKHRKRHSSSKDGSRHRHNHDSSSDVEHYHSRHCSSDDEHDPSCRRHRHKHHDTSDDEHSHSRHRDDDGSSDNKHRHSRHKNRHEDRNRSSKRRKQSESKAKTVMEEGEISSKSDQSKASGWNSGASRETSVEISKSHHDGLALSKSEATADTTDVPDDLRAKIRAMLMATL